MKIPRNTTVCSTLLGSVLLALMSVASAAPKFKTGADADVTHDGLHRIDDSVMKLAWAKPDLNLSQYTKIMVMPAGMSFKAVKGSGRSGDEFPLTQTQQARLRTTILEVFTEELAKAKRFTLTDRPGPDVLQVRGAILDVVSHVPPDPVGRGAVFLRTLGEATLVFELRDSMSDEILARAVDRRAAESTFMRKSTSVTNLSEIRLAARGWASQLRRRLDEFAASNS